MKNLRVLVISDEDTNVAEWHATMQRLETQTNSASTWQILTSPAVADGHDIVIVDTDSQEGNLGLCYLLRPLYNGAILLVIKNDDEAHLLAGYAAGADECIARPIGGQLLWAKIKMWHMRLETVRGVRRKLSAHPQSSSSSSGSSGSGSIIRRI
jgi:DNA-binding response OmpR family regulator